MKIVGQDRFPLGRLGQSLRRLFHRAGSQSGSNRALPYTVGVQRRNLEAEAIPAGGGVESFDTPEAMEINRARMSHLASLGLPIQGKRVLDVGCGAGHLAQFFVGQKCRVVCVDARQENIASLRARYPKLEAHVCNVETESLAQFGRFDIVFSYGLLYHLENPLAALRNMASVCDGLLLIETMVCDHELPLLRLEDETRSLNQALWGLGCRPTPSYVAMAMNRVGFPWVYAPRVPPDHPDFAFQWKNNLDAWREEHPLRCVFVASRASLQNQNLCDLLTDRMRIGGGKAG